jgi:hypothetical protein
LITDTRDIGGTTKAEWNGDGGLGGIDLTAGGDRFQLGGVKLFGVATFAETLTVRVTDTFGGVSAFTETYDDICQLSSDCNVDETFVGTYEIPFSSLSSGANLTSVDIIALEFFTTPVVSEADFEVGSFQVVSAIPVPAAVWLFGSGLLGLVGIARRKQTTRV